MQSQEFGKMMEGQQAMWAENIFRKGNFSELFKDVEENKEELRAEIEKQEVPIPAEIRSQIDTFIQHHKTLGTKARTIRRMVKRKFNIIVV